jgi:hypothetical protein
MELVILSALLGSFAAGAAWATRPSPAVQVAVVKRKERARRA